jgi:hypothetical protein
MPGCDSWGKAASVTPFPSPPHPAWREPRYATRAEQIRIRRILGWLLSDVGGADPGERRTLIDQYEYLLRTAFNSMLRDRRREYRG